MEHPYYRAKRKLAIRAAAETTAAPAGPAAAYCPPAETAAGFPLAPIYAAARAAVLTPQAAAEAFHRAMVTTHTQAAQNLKAMLEIEASGRAYLEKQLTYHREMIEYHTQKAAELAADPPAAEVPSS